VEEISVPWLPYAHVPFAVSDIEDAAGDLAAAALRQELQSWPAILQETVTQALWAHYQHMLGQVGDEYFLRVLNRDDVWNHLQRPRLGISQTAYEPRPGVVFVEFAATPTWEDEHGVVILLASRGELIGIGEPVYNPSDVMQDFVDDIDPSLVTRDLLEELSIGMLRSEVSQRLSIPESNNTGEFLRCGITLRFDNDVLRRCTVRPTVLTSLANVAFGADRNSVGAPGDVVSHRVSYQGKSYEVGFDFDVVSSIALVE
jgi:hypothetical protein